MAEEVLIEEFHLGVYVPRELPDEEVEAVRQTLDEASFRVRLLGAIGEVVRLHPALGRTSVRLSR
jgi:hypothetical protein